MTTLDRPLSLDRRLDDIRYLLNMQTLLLARLVASRTERTPQDVLSDVIDEIEEDSGE